MGMNNWEAFLSDPELTNSEWFRRQLNGQYLFGKILHDTLECLNNFKGIYSLAVSKEVSQNINISTSSLRWFTQKMQAIELAVIEITQLWDFYEKLPITSDEWPHLIKSVGSKLSDVQKFAHNREALDQSVQGMERDFITMAMANLRGAKAIYEDIQVENYKQLLVTRKYQKFNS